MRFYSIVIRNKDTKEIIRPRVFDKLALDASYTSYVNGQSIRGALNVHLDVPLAPYAVPRQGAYVQIDGVSLEEIQQSADLNLHDIEVFAGMRKGLPLAKPEQSQLPLVQGTIFQAFGNRQGTMQSLNLVIVPYTGTPKNPINLTLAWRAKTQLSDAIRTSLQTAFKGYTITVQISKELTKASDEVGMFNSLNEFATQIQSLTTTTQFKGIKPLGGGAYTGVSILPPINKTILVVDGTVATAKPLTAIAFEDLIGQPTWIGPNTINFKTAMRTDITVGDDALLPTQNIVPYVITTPNAAFSGVPARSRSIFQGKFRINEAHAFGNFRQADGSSWVSSFNAYSLPFENATIGSASP